MQGLKKKYKTQCGMAVTGIAGPGGGSLEKPVGTVYIGVFHENFYKVQKYLFKSDNRKEIQEKAVLCAIDMLEKMVTNTSSK